MDKYGYVFIPGGGMSTWVWRDLDEAIRSKSVLIEKRLKNNSHKERMNASLDDCAGHMAEQLASAGFSKYIIVAHSGGGLLAPLLASKIAGKTAGIIFVAASIPRDQATSLDSLPLPVRVLNLIAARRQMKVESTPVMKYEKMITRVFCNTASEEVLAYVLRQNLLTEPLCVYKEKVSRKGIPEVPMTYIRLLRDKTISVQGQDRMAANLNIHAKYDIDSGHMAMLTHPREFNQALRVITEKYLYTG